MIGTTSINGIARLNANGTLDTGFNPNPEANYSVYSVAVQDDGKVLFGGRFRNVQPNGTGPIITRKYIARVTSSGVLDTTFDPNLSFYTRSIAVQADKKILIGGPFTTLQPNQTGPIIPRNRIARFFDNGTLDTGFDPNAGASVLSMAVQTDGKVLLGGSFSTINGTTTRNHIARITATGLADSFDPNVNTDVFAVTQKVNGMALLGGDFTALQPNGASSPTARNLFACVFNDSAAQTLTVPSSTQALWTRSGAGPELIWSTFEVGPTANGPWGPPVFATRVGTTSNWQTASLSLPASGFIRACGRTVGGLGNGSSGIIEQIECFPGTDLPLWRTFHFGSSANSGNGANTADPDFDGLANLAEYAFGLNPNSGSSLQPPPAVLSGGNLSFTFTQPTGVSCINYGAEWSIDLIHWFPIPDTGGGSTRNFSVPVGTNPMMFMRHRILEH